MSNFMNKKMNMSIGYLSSSATQNVVNNTDITIFDAPVVLAGSFPNVYKPTTSTIYLPKGFYYFVECGLKLYRGTNANALKYAIVDTSNTILSNNSKLRIVGEITDFYPRKCYAFFDCINQSKTIKVRVIETYDMSISASNVTLTINGSQDATSSTNFVYSEPMSRIIIKAWNNNSFTTNLQFTSTIVALTGASQLTSDALNKYHTYSLSNTGYVYYMPVSPNLNDVIGFCHLTGTGNFQIRLNVAGIFLSPAINSTSIRKSYVFKWDGTDWIDIGEFTISN